MWTSVTNSKLKAVFTLVFKYSLKLQFCYNAIEAANVSPRVAK